MSFCDANEDGLRKSERKKGDREQGDERGNLSTQGCRLACNCFPHDCHYGVSEVEPTDFARGQNFRHVFDSCLCNIISGWRTELLWNSFFLCKIEKEARAKKGGRREAEACSHPDESAEGGRQARAQRRVGDNCAGLAVVLITVHRLDWSALLDGHYCY